jgi:hypothetical protein
MLTQRNAGRKSREKSEEKERQESGEERVVVPKLLKVQCAIVVQIDVLSFRSRLVGSVVLVRVGLA